MTASAAQSVDTAPQAAGGDLPVMAFVADEVTQQAMIRLGAERKWSEPTIVLGGVPAARDELRNASGPIVLIIDLSTAADALAAINELAELCEPGTRVIALGTANDVRLYRSLVEAGVADYLVKPVTAADIGRAMDSALSLNKPDGALGANGRIVAVIGARGGVGASTVAANLGWLLSQEQGQRVALVDLDLQFGTIALSLDIEPGTGFRDVLQNPSRIDPLFLERAAIRVNETLAILGVEDALVDGGHWSAEAFVPLLAELSKSFDHIVLDIPRGFASQHPEIIAAIASAVLVTDLSLAGMRDALRIRSMLREVAPQANCKVVVNRARPSSKGDMPLAEFEKSIDDAVLCDVPFDAKSAAEASAHGKPIAAIAKTAKSSAALRKISQSMAATKAKKKKKTPSFDLARLFKP